MKHEKFSEIKKIIEFDPLDNDYKPRIGCVECSLLESVCRKHLLVKYNYMKYLIEDLRISIEAEETRSRMSSFRMRRQRKKMKTLWKKVDVLMEWRKRR